MGVAELRGTEVSSGGGLSGPNGIASGVSTKDELKDFHAVLAVQATSQQVTQFAALVKISEAASAELRSFREQLGKENSRFEIAGRGATLTRRSKERGQKTRNSWTDFRSGRSPG